LAKECYITKLELLTNATVVSDTLKFIANHQNHGNNNSKDDFPNLGKNSTEIQQTTTMQQQIQQIQTDEIF
jgi:hypothetical protein